MKRLILIFLALLIPASGWAFTRVNSDVRVIRSLATGETGTDSTTLNTDSITVDEFGNWLILVYADMRCNDLSNQAQYALMRGTDTLRSWRWESPTTGSNNDYFPLFGASVYRKSSDASEKIYLQCRNESVDDSALVRNRVLVALNLDDYGRENIDWVYDHNDVTELGTTWTDVAYANFTPTTTGDWFIIHNAQYEMWAATDVGEHRLQLRNEDRSSPVVRTEPELHFTPNANTDRLWSQSFWIYNCKADSNYSVASQWQERSGDSVTVYDDEIIALRTDMFASFNLDTMISTTVTSANIFVPRVQETDTLQNGAPVFNIAPEFVFTNGAWVVNSGKMELRSDIFQNTTRFDSIPMIRMDVASAGTDTIPISGFAYMESNDTLNTCDVDLWALGNVLNDKYRTLGLFLFSFANRFSNTTDDSTMFYRSIMSSSGIDDTYLDEGAPTTNNGTSTSLRLGEGAANVSQNIIINDVSYYTAAVDSIDGVDNVVACTLWVMPKVFPVAGDTIVADFYNQDAHATWTETGATWNSYDGTNSWTTAGGDGTKEIDAGIRFIGLSGSRMIVHVNQTYWDTVYATDNKYVPMVLNASIGNSQGLFSKGVIIKTREDSTTTGAQIDFHSSESGNPPFFTYGYVERGEGSAIIPPAGEGVTVVGLADDEMIPLDANAVVHDWYLHGASSLQATTLMGSATIQTGWYGVQLVMQLGFTPNGIDSIIPAGKKIDSVVMGFPVIATPAVEDTTGNLMALRVSTTRKGVDFKTRYNLGGSGKGPSFLYNGASSVSTTDTTWATPGAFSQTFDINAPLFTTDCCRTGGDFDGTTRGDAVETGWTSTLDASIYQSTADNSRYLWWLKLPVSYFNKLDSGTYTDQGNGIPFPLSIWNDQNNGTSGNGWRIYHRQLHSGSFTQTIAIYFFISDATSSATSRRRILLGDNRDWINGDGLTSAWLDNFASAGFYIARKYHNGFIPN